MQGQQRGFGYIHFDDNFGVAIVDHVIRSVAENPLFGLCRFWCECSKRTAHLGVVSGATALSQPPAVRPVCLHVAPPAQTTPHSWPLSSAPHLGFAGSFPPFPVLGVPFSMPAAIAGSSCVQITGAPMPGMLFLPIPGAPLLGTRIPMLGEPTPEMAQAPKGSTSNKMIFGSRF